MAFYPRSIPANSGFYFREPEDKKAKKASKTKHTSTESAANLVVPEIKSQPASITSKDADINPFAYAMASIYNRSHPNSRNNSRANTPAPSRPASVHNNEDKEINAYAYAMGSIYKRSHSRSRSATPAQSRPASVHREAEDKDLNPYAYALGSIYRRSFSRSPSAQNSRASSVAPAH